MTQAVEPQRKYSRKLSCFLRVLSETGDVTGSAKLAGFSDTGYLYYVRKTNKDFAADWVFALDKFGDVLEAEAVRRATKGVTKEIYYKGCVVGSEQVYSDGLMAKLLDGAKPDKYKPRENSGQTNVNVRVGIAVVPMTAPSIEDWERDAAIEAAQDAAIDAVNQQNQVKALPPPTDAVALKIVRV